MEIETRILRNLELSPLGSWRQHQVQVQPVSGGAPLAFSPLENTLPQPTHTTGSEHVMIEEQMETLRRQISVYATICQQLVEMHKASLTQESLPGIMVGGHHLPYDQLIGTHNHKTATRLRWTPTQTQLQILESLFEQGSGTPNKQRIKEITAELSQHGQIADTNVYNWFQNRKARAKRKQQQVGRSRKPRLDRAESTHRKAKVPLKEGESEVDTDVDSPREKRPRLEGEEVQNDPGNSAGADGGGSSDGAKGATLEQEPAQFETFDQKDTDSSILLQQTGDIKPDIACGTSIVFAQQSLAQGSIEGSKMKVNMDDNSQWDVLGDVLQRPTCGDNTFLSDSQGQDLQTNEGALRSMQTGERYSLAGFKDSEAEAVQSENMVSQRLQHVVGFLNQGLANESMMNLSSAGQMLGNLQS